MTGNLKRRDHIKAEEKYKMFREIAFESTMEEFPEIEVKGITYLDALTADRWKAFVGSESRMKRGTWDWAKEYSFYNKRPNRFEVSLWKGGILGALCYGQTSKQKAKVRMNLIESTPERPSPLGMKALPVLSYAAAVFAEIIGAEELWVLDPDISLEEVYKREGFGSRTIIMAVV